MAAQSFSRRTLLLGSISLPFASAAMAVAEPFAEKTLDPWQPGGLDIHHIATGQGNATLVIFPDGTSLLIDAGATASTGDVVAAPKPGPQRRAGEWVGLYAQRHLKAAGLSQLDYLLVTHLHPDHVGDVSASTPLAPDGSYRLTGVSDVAELVKIETLIDRGFPDYAYPVVESANFAKNYRAFIASRLRRGQAVQRFEAGSASQFKPAAHFKAAGPFGVQNIAANGRVWTGKGSETKELFPPLAELGRMLPNENMCSTAIRLHSGPFTYFTAGDLTSDTSFGAYPWRDVLSTVARVAGRVDVATADHHGLFDSLSAEVARALQPRIWVVQAWHASHPSVTTLEMMHSETLYPGERDIFTTNMTRANELAHGRLLRRSKSLDGNIIIRVKPGGETFSVVVTRNEDTTDAVKLVLGPLRSGAATAAGS